MSEQRAHLPSRGQSERLVPQLPQAQQQEQWHQSMVEVY